MRNLKAWENRIIYFLRVCSNNNEVNPTLMNRLKFEPPFELKRYFINGVWSLTILGFGIADYSNIYY
jgi:hypothetical protein